MSACTLFRFGSSDGGSINRSGVDKSRGWSQFRVLFGCARSGVGGAASVECTHSGRTDPVLRAVDVYLTDWMRSSEHYSCCASSFIYLFVVSSSRLGEKTAFWRHDELNGWWNRRNWAARTWKWTWEGFVNYIVSALLLIWRVYVCSRLYACVCFASDHFSFLPWLLLPRHANCVNKL